jgi:hypothetical protein
MLTDNERTGRDHLAALRGQKLPAGAQGSQLIGPLRGILAVSFAPGQFPFSAIQLDAPAAQRKARAAQRVRPASAGPASDADDVAA